MRENDEQFFQGTRCVLHLEPEAHVSSHTRENVVCAVRWGVYRCLDSVPLVPSPMFPHVSMNSCTKLLLDTEVEFHDFNHAADRIDDTLVIGLLQLGCVWECAPNSSRMNASWFLLLALADAGGLCTLRTAIISGSISAKHKSASVIQK